MRLLVLFLITSFGFALVLAPAPMPEGFPGELATELNGVLAKYEAAVPIQRQAMLGAEMVADYDARFTELHEQGRWRMLKSVSRLGDVTFKAINSFVGDDRVRKELILRSMEEEQKARAYGALAVTAAEYRFTINAIKRDKSRTTYVFDVKPRKRSKESFEGQIEVDGETGMPLREMGKLSKNPHWILSNVRFIREYQLVDGISVVKHFESRANVRFLGIGPAEIIADYSDYRPAGEEPAREHAL